MRTLVASGVALIAATYGLARFGYGLFLPRFVESFAVGATAAGVISAGSFVSYCVASVLAARLGGRPRLVVLCAGATATSGSVLVAAAPGVLVLALGVLVAGAGAGFASPGLVALVQRGVPPARQEGAQTTVNAGSGVGLVAAGVLVLVSGQHWRLGWLVVATAALLATVATLAADRGTGRRASRPPTPTPAPVTRPRAADLVPLARPVVAATLAGLASAAVWTFGPSLLAAARPAGGAGYATGAWLVLGACGVLGAAAGQVVRAVGLTAVWGLTCAAMAVATAVVGLAPGVPVLAHVAVGVFGAAYTALSGVLVVWAVRATPASAAAGTVVLFVALAVGQAVGSAGFGVLQGVVPAGVTFVVAGAVGLLALLPARSRVAETATPR